MRLSIAFPDGELTVTMGDNEQVGCEYHGVLPRDLAMALVERHRDTMRDLQEQMVANLIAKTVKDAPGAG
jgi:hypothetical protein